MFKDITHCIDSWEADLVLLLLTAEDVAADAEAAAAPADDVVWLDDEAAGMSSSSSSSSEEPPSTGCGERGEVVACSVLGCCFWQMYLESCPMEQISSSNCEHQAAPALSAEHFTMCLYMISNKSFWETHIEQARNVLTGCCWGWWHSAATLLWLKYTLLCMSEGVIWRSASQLTFSQLHSSSQMIRYVLV